MMTQCNKCGDVSDSPPGLMCGRVEPGSWDGPCDGTYRLLLDEVSLDPSRPESLRYLADYLQQECEGVNGWLMVAAMARVIVENLKGRLGDEGGMPETVLRALMRALMEHSWSDLDARRWVRQMRLGER
jgi:hypothetical protein